MQALGPRVLRLSAQDEPRGEEPAEEEALGGQEQPRRGRPGSTDDPLSYWKVVSAVDKVAAGSDPALTGSTKSRAISAGSR